VSRDGARLPAQLNGASPNELAVYNNMSSPRRVGYWISDKKGKKLNFDGFVNYCRHVGLELVKIDLSQPLEGQGPFDAIIHKLTDIIAKADNGSVKDQKYIEKVEAYFSSHPELPILDPIDKVRQLLDRNEQYKLVVECPIVAKGDEYIMPTFVEFATKDVATNRALMKEAQVTFPFVCKPILAHGFSRAHQMALIFNEEGLADVDPPCVAQTFINHEAIMYKIFVIGNHCYTVERPSLKNFKACDHKTIWFDSHDISKAESDSVLSKLDDDDEPCRTPLKKPDPRKLEDLALRMKDKFQLNLFGVDVIIDNTTGKYAIIDINAFPGYDGMPNVFQVLSQLIESSINDSKCKSSKTFPVKNGGNLATTNSEETNHGGANGRLIAEDNATGCSTVTEITTAANVKVKALSDSGGSSCVQQSESNGVLLNTLNGDYPT